MAGPLEAGIPGEEVLNGPDDRRVPATRVNWTAERPSCHLDFPCKKCILLEKGGRARWAS
jgi:hypothetical protein